MQLRKLAGCALVALAVLMTSVSAQAGMLTTAQMQSTTVVIPADIAGQRDWILERLIQGGVAESDAKLRVAALTDAQIVQLHDRIDQEPAGGDILLVLIIALFVSEAVGWTDFIPVIRPAE